MRVPRAGVYLVQIHRNRNKIIVSSSSCNPLVHLHPRSSRHPPKGPHIHRQTASLSVTGVRSWKWFVPYHCRSSYSSCSTSVLFLSFFSYAPLASRKEETFVAPSSVPRMSARLNWFSSLFSKCHHSS